MINAVHKALVVQQQRKRQDAAERKLEQAFLRRMQALEWDLHGRAATAPATVRTMIVLLLWEDEQKQKQSSSSSSSNCNDEQKAKAEGTEDERQKQNSSSSSNDKHKAKTEGTEDEPQHWCLALLDRIVQRWGHCFQEPSHAEYAWHHHSGDGTTNNNNKKNPRTPGTYTLYRSSSSTAYAAIATTGLTEALGDLVRQGIVDRTTGALTDEWYAELDAPLLEDGVVPPHAWKRTDEGWVNVLGCGEESDDDNDSGGGILVYRHAEQDELLEQWRRTAEMAAGIGQFF